MKKFYTIASFLLLTVCMALTTACSNDNDIVIDEPVVPEQPTEGTRTVTLKASANMGGETRVAVEGVEGKEDAFRITGWKDGDKVEVLALKDASSNSYCKITFTYSASTEEFTGNVPADYELSDLKFAYAGANSVDVGVKTVNEQYEWKVSLGIPIAFSDPKNCFLFGEVNTDGESISAALSAPYALACVHNYTEDVLKVGLITNSGNYLQDLAYCWVDSQYILKRNWDGHVFKDQAYKYSVPVDGKAYFVIPPKDKDGNYYGLYNFASDLTIAEPKENVTLGKVYKVKVTPTTGTAKRKSGSNSPDVDEPWVQLWAGGPKFAVENVYGANYKEISSGGYYQWGGIQWDQSDGYNTGSTTLTGNEDTATSNWGNNWRMPTYPELEGLYKYCDVTWTEQNGVYGCEFTGRGYYSRNSIFLPAAGAIGNNDVEQWDIYGFYWSSSPAPYDDTSACVLGIKDGTQVVITAKRAIFASVRPVLAE